MTFFIYNFNKLYIPKLQNSDSTGIRDKNYGDRSMTYKFCFEIIAWLPTLRFEAQL